MAVIQKTLFAKNLDRYSVLVNDTDPNSKYFKVTELPDTFTGGKNAFLVAGGSELVGDTKIQIELKDSNGNIIYHEPAEGLISSSINGENFVTEYYEGVSKVVSVYIYPDTAYGACTLTILGELSQYVDENGITQIVPVDWENKYNVKWQKSINVNPSLVNTTKIRFYQRPQATITEILNPIYTIVSGSKVASAVTQSFADIKLSKLETFAGDVKRVKVFRTSEGDISDFDLIQDILVESKELLTSYGLSGSVIGQTGILTSETLKNYWNTGSLNAFLTSSRVESGVRLTGSGYFTYTSSLDIKSANTYELNLDAFYSASISTNLGIYLVSGSASSSIATLAGIQPTKNLLDTVIPFKIDRDYPSASLYFSQSQGEWHLGNISLKLSQDTAFSPDEISFVTTMPTDINNQTYNFKFEFYDVNNNYVPVAVTQSAVFTGGNAGATAKLLTFQTDRSAFRFSTGSYGNPANQTVKFSTQKTNLTGSVTYASSAFDIGGNYITPASYAGTYPGTLTNASDNGALLTIANFSGSVTNTIIGSIVYTASCENFIEFETIYRFEDGDNAPGVFVTANTNQFIYKATDLSLNPAGQIITIEAKRKNLASAVIPLTVNSGSGKPGLTFVSTNATNGVDTYTISGTSYPYSTDETIYSISGSDQFGNVFSDAIKITPIKILDGFSIATSNENTSFPANSVGSVIGGFAASSGSITVKVGNEVISYSSPIANNKFSASISATSGLTANTFNGTNYSINALSADSGSLTLLVKYQDGGGTQISSSKEITYSKVKKAAPVLSFVIGNNNQTTTAKSTGAQIDTFVTASFTVNETYDGVTTTKTFTPTSITTTNSYQTGSTTSATLALPGMATATDSVDISITGSVVDSESTTRFVFGNISLAKVKKAVPNIIITATPLTQTISATSQSIQVGTLLPVTLDALEGATSVFNSASIVSSNFTSPSISTNTLTLGSIGNSISAASASISVNFTNSEGTSNNSTILVSATKVNAGNTGATGSAGTNGASGSNGNDGKRTAANMVHYQLSSATAPATPTATSYTFATNVFTGLTANWGLGAPTYASGNSNKYWYSTYTVVETTAGGGTGTPTFGSPIQAIGFSGLVSFTTANNFGDGTNALSFGVAGATLINGSNISTGIIKSTNFDFGGADTDASGSFMDAGTIFNLDNGSLRSKNFYVTSAGDAFFRGNLAVGSTVPNSAVTGLGSLALSSSVSTQQMTGLGSLALSSSVSTGQVTGLGALAVKNDITLSYITNAGTLAGKSSVTNAELADLAVTSGKLDALAVTSGKIAAEAVIAGKIAANAVTADTIAATSITAGKIAVGTITADRIATNTLTANEIATNTLTATQISSLVFTGKSASFDTGNIGGWTINSSNINKIGSTHTIKMDSTNNAFTFTENSTSKLRMAITASTNIPDIAITSQDSITYTHTGTNRYSITTTGPNTYNSGGDSNRILTATSGRGDGPVNLGYAGTGIIFLQYPTEEIWVDTSEINADIFFMSLLNNVDTGDASSFTYQTYTLDLRVRKFADYNDANAGTNVITTYTRRLAELTRLQSGDEFAPTDTINVNGASIEVTSASNWFKVDLVQNMQTIVFEGGTSIMASSTFGADFDGAITVRFGQIGNGYSILGPGGIQVYQGFRNYMKSAVASAAGANFFEVQGKSTFLSGLAVSGSFSATTKQFQITHPLNEKKWLYHTSVESPRADLIYRGILQLENGSGSVGIDSSSRMTIGTFDILTKERQLFLQNNDSFDRVMGKIESGSLYVISENTNATASINWLVTAERNDIELQKSNTYFDGKYKVEKYKSIYLKEIDDEMMSKFSGSI